MSEELEQAKDITETLEELESDASQSSELTGFQALGVTEELAQSLFEKGWESPTEIQEKSLPFSLKGKDVAGFAQTGTGKTGAFLITFAEKFLALKASGKAHSKKPCALILCPTRELALQIEHEASSLLDSLHVRSLAVYGGSSIEPQAKSLKKGVDLIVATPGRLIDLQEQKLLSLDHIQLFICDEVDRMFDMGFSKEVEKIMDLLPKGIQRLAFSATADDRAKELCKKYLKEPEFVTLNQAELTPEAIKQNAIICENTDKIKLLISLLRKHDPICAIVFTNTKIVASWLLFKLEKNHFNAKMISGDLPQNKRTKLIKDIKDGNIKILIATDVASRGLHIPNVTHVYNFDLPDDSANYVHRIGRTARAGASGESYSFICEDYAENFEAIKKLLGDKAPKPTYLQKESIQDIEDLGVNPFGPPPKKPLLSFQDRRPEENFSRDSYKREHSRSFSRERGSSRPSDSQPRRKFDSDKPRHSHSRREENPRHKRYESSSHKQNRGPKKYPKRSQKPEKGLLKKLFSGFFKK